MGLLDNLMLSSNANFGGQNAGLLDMLRTFQMQQSQYQPSAGFAADPNQPSPLDTTQYPAGPVGVPSNAMAQAPAGQNPIAVGDYQMPRIGDPQQFAGDPAALPSNAQPTQGQMPPQPMQVPSLTPPSGPNFGDKLAAGFQSWANTTPGNIIGGIANGIAGFSTGQRNDKLGMAQQSANVTARALLAKGIDPTAVQAAITNPELMKTLITQAYGPQTVTSLGQGYVADRNGKITRAFEPDDKTKVVKIGQDSLGREQYGVFNPADGSIKPYTPPTATPGQDPLGNTNLSGKEYLATLPKEQANTVQLMVEGKIPPPTSFAMSKPYWQNMISAAKNYDPTFDATSWSGRVAGTRDFSAGKSAEMVRAANQTLHHVGSLLDSMDKLQNGPIPVFNSIGNTVAEARGSGAQGAFRTNAHAVAEELSKVFKGNNLSDAEIRSWEQNLHENMSPEQQRTQVAKLNELLQGSLHALEEKRIASIGPIAAEKAGPIIKEEGQRVIERINDWVTNGGDKAAAPAPQAAPAVPDRSAIEAEMRRRGLLK